MTNRVILNDPRLGAMPADQREWTGLHRQLAEATAPGFLSSALLSNFSASSATFATVTDSSATNLSISLKANVKYYISLFGAYNRQSADGAKVRLAFSGTTSGQPEDSARAVYHLSGTGETVDSLYNPLDTTGLVMTTATGNGYVFSIEGWINVTAKGELTIQFAQNTGSATAATLYSGTRVIAQPVINLADRNAGT